MKHTQGPWTVCGLNIGSENNKVVASCYKDSLDSVVVRPETDCECLANARLIAAAPALLEACKLVERAWVGDGIEMLRAVDECLLAVGKAEKGK